MYLLQTNTLSCVYVPQGNERGIELFQTTIGNFPVSAPAPEDFMEISKKTRGNRERCIVVSNEGLEHIGLYSVSGYFEETTIMQIL